MTRFTVEMEIKDEIDIAILHDTVLHLLSTMQPANMSVVIDMETLSQYPPPSPEPPSEEINNQEFEHDSVSSTNEKTEENADPGQDTVDSV